MFLHFLIYHDGKLWEVEILITLKMAERSFCSGGNGLSFANVSFDFHISLFTRTPIRLVSKFLLVNMQWQRCMSMSEGNEVEKPEELNLYVVNHGLCKVAEEAIP